MNKISVLCALHTFGNKAYNTQSALSQPGILTWENRQSKRMRWQNIT